MLLGSYAGCPDFSVDRVVYIKNPHLGLTRWGNSLALLFRHKGFFVEEIYTYSIFLQIFLQRIHLNESCDDSILCLQPDRSQFSGIGYESELYQQRRAFRLPYEPQFSMPVRDIGIHVPGSESRNVGELGQELLSFRRREHVAVAIPYAGTLCRGRSAVQMELEGKRFRNLRTPHVDPWNAFLEVESFRYFYDGTSRNSLLHDIVDDLFHYFELIRSISIRSVILVRGFYPASEFLDPVVSCVVPDRYEDSFHKIIENDIIRKVFWIFHPLIFLVRILPSPMAW